LDCNIVKAEADFANAIFAIWE